MAISPISPISPSLVPTPGRFSTTASILQKNFPSRPAPCILELDNSINPAGPCLASSEIEF